MNPDLRLTTLSEDQKWASKGTSQLCNAFHAMDANMDFLILDLSDESRWDRICVKVWLKLFPSFAKINEKKVE